MNNDINEKTLRALKLTVLAVQDLATSDEINEMRKLITIPEVRTGLDAYLKRINRA